MGAPCSTIQSAMSSAFDSVTCTGTASCDCVVKSHADVDDSSRSAEHGDVATRYSRPHGCRAPGEARDRR